MKSELSPTERDGRKKAIKRRVNREEGDGWTMRSVNMMRMQVCVHSEHETSSKLSQQLANDTHQTIPCAPDPIGFRF